MRDTHWAQWSLGQLKTARLAGPLVINDVIYAELSVDYESSEALDAFVEGNELDIIPIPREALFLAGKAFIRYRKSGGIRTGVLPDFFIGAHAAVRELPLLARDVRRYRTYFPTVILIAPNLS